MFKSVCVQPLMATCVADGMPAPNLTFGGLDSLNSGQYSLVTVAIDDFTSKAELTIQDPEELYYLSCEANIDINDPFAYGSDYHSYDLGEIDVSGSDSLIQLAKMYARMIL
jgi:hypothetical protein